MRGTPKHFNTRYDIDECLLIPEFQAGAINCFQKLTSEQLTSLGYSTPDQYVIQDKYGGPYKNWNVVYIGDSFMTYFPAHVTSLMGFDATNLLTTIALNNFTDPVIYFWDVIDTYPEVVDVYFNAAYHRNVVISRNYQYKTLNHGRVLDTDQMLALLREWYADRKAAGWMVVQNTYQPASNGYTGNDDDPALELERAEVNAAMLANPELYADVLVDITTNPYIGVRHCETSEVYFQDRLHTTSAGALVAAELVDSAIKAYMFLNVGKV